MSAERLSLDTNILFYTIDADAGERHERAREIVDQAALGDCVLTLQTLSEFFASTTRKGKLTVIQAAAHVEDWQALFPGGRDTGKPPSCDAGRRAAQPLVLGCHAMGGCQAGRRNAALE